MKDKREANRIIDILGGTVAVAEMFGTTPQAVSQWRSRGLPPARELYLRDMRPDLWGIRAVRRVRRAKP